MKRAIAAALAAATLIVAGASTASAATIFIERNIDIADAMLVGSGVVGYTEPPGRKLYSIGVGFFETPITLAEGDVLEFTVNFTGAPLTISDPDFLSLIVGATGSGTYSVHTTTGTLELLTPTGPLRPVSDTVTQTECCAFLGNRFYADDFSTGPGDVSFTGVRLVMTVDDFASIQSGTYGTGRFFFTQAVPEPTTWAMMIVGFGLTGAAVRRRARAALA